MPVTVHVNVEAEPGLPDVEAVIERATLAAARAQSVEDGEFSVTLLPDDRMAALNREWLDRDGPTDVLAFGLEGPDGLPVGDIYLGVQRAAAQAEEVGEPPLRELARLAIHGTLHTLGWDHPEADREASDMWREQERILDTLELA